MQKIEKIARQIEEEIEGASCYAETYIELVLEGNSSWANKYRDMAQQELTHATWLHERATEMIQRLKSIYTAPPEMQEAWDNVHTEYVEKAKEVKKMLQM